LIVKPTWPVFLASLVAAVFIIYRHRGNIVRLRAGKESVFTWGSRR